MSKFFHVSIIPPAVAPWTKTIGADDYDITRFNTLVMINFIREGVIVEQISIPDTFGYSLSLRTYESN